MEPSSLVVGRFVTNKSQPASIAFSSPCVWFDDSALLFCLGRLIAIGRRFRWKTHRMNMCLRRGQSYIPCLGAQAPPRRISKYSRPTSCVNHLCRSSKPTFGLLACLLACLRYDLHACVCSIPCMSRRFPIVVKGADKSIGWSPSSDTSTVLRRLDSADGGGVLNCGLA